MKTENIRVGDTVYFEKTHKCSMDKYIHTYGVVTSVTERYHDLAFDGFSYGVAFRDGKKLYLTDDEIAKKLL